MSVDPAVGIVYLSSGESHDRRPCGVTKGVWGVRFARVRYSAALKFILILGAAAAILATSAAARTNGGSSGDIHNAVYVETNDPTANAIIVYQRGNDGTLTQRQSVLTGGLGSGANQPFGFPITDSQGAVVLKDDGNLLFAVNAGNNSVSSFRVTSKGLRLVDVAWSGGKLPISVTTEGNVLYALNEPERNHRRVPFQQSRRVDADPRLSTQSLSTPGAERRCGANRALARRPCVDGHRAVLQ